MRPVAPGTRGAQIVLLGLLVVCAGQIVFWMYDEIRFTRSVRAWRDAVLDQRVVDAVQRVDEGSSLEDLRERYPDLDIRREGVSVPPVQREMAHAAVDGRVRRFLSEGIFFLATLFAAAFIVLRALSQRARYARLQANFLAAITHELKSPLASIRLSTETLLLRDPERDGRETKLRRTLVDLERLERMVGNILETRRLDEGGESEQQCEVCMADLMQEAVDEVDAWREDPSFSFEVEAGPDCQVFADPAGVRTILRNLVDNAIKAVVRGQGSRIVLRCRTERQRVLLEVIDDGVGFEPGEAERVFERFYRVGDELRRESAGTGLGLHLVQRCAERDGARVHASSEGLGRGACLRVSWPRREG